MQVRLIYVKYIELCKQCMQTRQRTDSKKIIKLVYYSSDPRFVQNHSFSYCRL